MDVLNYNNNTDNRYFSDYRNNYNNLNIAHDNKSNR